MTLNLTATDPGPVYVVPDILGQVQRHLKSLTRVLPHQSNWASSLADPCVRRLVYYRTHWDAQPEPSPWLQGIFETGKKIERVVVNILNEIGQESRPEWELVARGGKVNDDFCKQHQIGGVPDVFLKVWPQAGLGDRPKILGPVEIKGLDGNLFRAIHTVQDLDQKRWLRRYFGQLTIYELQCNYETGWFLLINKSNLYEYKFLELPLDLEYAEDLVRKADTVNAHIAAGTLPDQFNDPGECNGCPFAALCCPSCGTGGTLGAIEHEELEGCLLRLSELADVAKEIGGLEKQRDAILDNYKGKDLLCGDFMISWKHSGGTHPAKPATPWEQWRKKISRLCGD
jgi:hypothetical protein